MSVSISSFMSRWFGKPEYRVLMGGLDASGKTTILYKLKLGDIVCTIPTIGFNVETIEFKKAQLTMWDVGGCDKIRPLWRHYFQGTNLVIFVVDSNDRERLLDRDTGAWDIFRMTQEEELRDVPILIYANKQDLPNAMNTAQIVDALQLKSIKGREWYVQSACATHGDGLYEGLDWALGALERFKKKSAQKSEASPTDTDDKAKGGKAKQDESKENADAEPEHPLVRWLAQEDEPDQEFLTKLVDYTLEEWDHRAHLRIAWLYLTLHGRREGMKLIFSGIKGFIENSKRTVKTKFHETMTYFWIHMVHYAICSTANPSGTFKGFLFMNPQLSDGGLFLEYYTKKLMLLTPEARTQVVLPDLKPLPSIIPASKAQGAGSGALKVQPVQAAAHAEDVAVPPDGLEQKNGAGRKERVAYVPDMADDVFMKAMDEGTLSSWGHEIFLRFLFVSVKEKGRKEGLNHVMAVLEKLLKTGYHFTSTYFWFHMVHLGLAKLEKSGKEPQWLLLKDASPELFDNTLISTYYSDDVLYGAGAEKEMRLPDKKKLPDML